MKTPSGASFMRASASSSINCSAPMCSTNCALKIAPSDASGLLPELLERVTVFDRRPEGSGPLDHREVKVHAPGANICVLEESEHLPPATAQVEHWSLIAQQFDVDRLTVGHYRPRSAKVFSKRA